MKLLALAAVAGTALPVAVLNVMDVHMLESHYISLRPSGRLLDTYVGHRGRIGLMVEHS